MKTSFILLEQWWGEKPYMWLFEDYPDDWEYTGSETRVSTQSSDSPQYITFWNGTQANKHAMYENMKVFMDELVQNKCLIKYIITMKDEEKE